MPLRYGAICYAKIYFIVDKSRAVTGIIDFKRVDVVANYFVMSVLANRMHTTTLYTHPKPYYDWAKTVLYLIVPRRF